MSSQRNSFKKITPLVQNFAGKVLQKKIPLYKVFIFGSYAKGKAHRDSDIDVCFISPEFKDSFEAAKFLFNLREPAELDIEPVAFSPKNFVDENPLVWEIKQHGIEIPLKGTAKKRIPKNAEKANIKIEMAL